MHGKVWVCPEHGYQWSGVVCGGSSPGWIRSGDEDLPGDFGEHNDKIPNTYYLAGLENMEYIQLVGSDLAYVDDDDVDNMQEHATTTCDFVPECEHCRTKLLSFEVDQVLYDLAKLSRHLVKVCLRDFVLGGVKLSEGSVNIAGEMSSKYPILAFSKLGRVNTEVK
jgi:hypothetical protein